MTANSLVLADRIALLKEMWRGCAKTPEMVEAMLLICRRFQVGVKEIWDSLLKKMVQLQMHEKLRSVLDWLGTRPELATLASVPLAVQYLLMEPLKGVTKEKSAEAEVRLCETLLYLQTCRVAGRLDLVALGEKLVGLERPYMAAVVLAFMGRAEERRVLIALLEPFKNEKLKRDIDELCEFGVMSRITQLAIRYLYREEGEGEEGECEQDGED